jgi:hypothetical protein
MERATVTLNGPRLDVYDDDDDDDDTVHFKCNGEM